MRRINRLTARFVEMVTEPGLYPDGGGLWLQVTSPTAKSWIFRFTRHGRTRDMGLGSTITISLAEARKKALVGRHQLLEDVDPIDARAAQRAATKLARASTVTFRQCAERFIAAHESGWSNGRHAAQWPSTLRDHVYPVIGATPVQAIDTQSVMRVLEPIWTTRAETARRVRSRVENIIDWAKAQGYRTDANPARWRGHLDRLLPARLKVAPVEHHDAMNYADVPRFMAKLREHEGMPARCLELTILTWARTSEATGARWDEIDLEAKAWVIPAARMKGRKDHTVPLSDPAIEMLTNLPRTGDLVFEGAREGKPISATAMWMLLHRMGHDVTVHGFRSSARGWAGETTAHPREVIEHALAHQLKNKTEAAYARGTLLAKRRKLMADWARFCAGCAK